MEFLEANKGVVCIDPPKFIRPLLDRSSQFNLMRDCLRRSDLSDRVCVPNFCNLHSNDTDANFERMREVHMRFPIICKPSSAHGIETAHKMALVFNKEGLTQIDYPCLAQQFVNHGGKLFKLFVVGTKTFTQKRSSIANLSQLSTRPPVFFDSKKVSKNDCTTFDAENIGHGDVELGAEVVADEPLFHRIATVLRESIHLDLFGLDLIACLEDDPSESHGSPSYRWGIIDLNIFPDYIGIPNFPEYLENLVRQKLSLPLLDIPEKK
ncbi:unnamed protein product [Calicophoron daubneyi]